MEQCITGYIKHSSLSFGSSLVCPTKIYVGVGNNKIASLQYEEAATKNTFNVTIVTNLGEVVSNTQVYCTTNGQYYTTNSSGQISQIIETELNIKSLQFTWSTPGETEWSTVDGPLQQGTTTINNYTGTATISLGNTFIGNCDTALQTSSSSAGYRINSQATAGQYITIGTRQYIIAHADSNNVYVVLRYFESSEQFDFDGDATYRESTIAAKCSSWFSDEVPSVWKSTANAFTKVYTEGVTAECFIPTKDQVNGDWEYFSTQTNRRFYLTDGNSANWWTSTKFNTLFAWYLWAEDCLFYEGSLTMSYGFRPALAIKRSLFAS